MKETVCFEDVLLEPQYSEINSRSEINLGNTLKNMDTIELPIISAPMDTVTETSMAIAMNMAGGLGIIHRYNSIDKQAELVNDACLKGMCNVGAAIGVSDDFVQRARSVRDAGANVICVDVAHGHHAKVRYALQVLRNTLGNTVHIMAGNVATLCAFNDLADWGADSIRVGIGGGSICSTRIQTGHGVPTLQSIIDCACSDRDAMLIADGGIKTSGDIVKALGVGADFVMLGSLLAGTDETPGELLTTTSGQKVKVYRGMASKEAQKDWRGQFSSIEGISHIVTHKGSVRDVLKELEIGIRSGLSYSGAHNIQELQAKARLILQSSSSQFESSTHIKGI